MEEKILTTKKGGMPVLLLTVLLYIAAIPLCILGFAMAEEGGGLAVPGIALAVLAILWLAFGWIVWCGLKVLKPQEALVVTLFGKYIGTLKGEGFYFVNPFCTAFNPAARTRLKQSGDVDGGQGAPGVTVSANGAVTVAADASGKRISLKIMTLNNTRQKINDCLGNPVEIGIAVMWRVVDTAKAVFNVDNYKEYLSLQCDSALRNIVRIYPYDVAPNVDTTGDGVADEGSLRGSSEVVAARIRDEIQSRVEEAGLEIIEARITYLAYAPEIAAVMLQRQQASAIIDARKMIVDGAVGMVEMALEGPGAAQREAGGGAGRGAEGGHGVQPSGGPLRQPGCPAGCQLRQPVLIWRRRRSKSPCACRRSCTPPSRPGQRMTSGR